MIHFNSGDRLIKKYHILVLLGTAVLIAVTAVCKAAAPPDLTHDNQVNRSLTYNLGPTGMRGWIYTKAANFPDSCQGRTTTASRQILVTHVGKNTPADGVMQVDDVILGVAGTPFTEDARQTFGAAITEAEKTGVLRLNRWRAGKIAEVQLRLPVLGAYSATAPYDCPKSKRILAAACKVLGNEPLKDDALGTVTGLALLATGNPEYLPKVQAYARQIAPHAQKAAEQRGLVVWDWGYRNLFLCEYYQITHDAEVLPAIRTYTTLLAKGQSLYGTFGHGLAYRTEDGQLHGSIPPYGPVNAAGLIANISIVMGKRCGVTDPEIDPAIERAAKFFAYFVDKGAIPYGEHEPWPYHENNGKNAMTAILFALQPSRVVETKFFAKMCTASFNNREYGHTGQGFSYLWGALGANAGGPAAVAAFFREAAWYFDLERRCDGSFVYDGGEQYGPGKTDDNTYSGKSGYHDLNPTACHVLTYALPLQKLWITGKEFNLANRLTAKDVSEALVSGKFYDQRQKKTAAELVGALGDWSPVVRGWAAEELAKRPDAKAMVPELLTMAEGEDAWKRQGACETLGYIKDPAALPVLVRLLAHPDHWLRVKAAKALKNLGNQAKPVVADMLKALAATGKPTLPVQWDDPVQISHGQLADVVFSGALRDSLKSIDPQLLYPAIQAVAKIPDGMARAHVSHTLTDQLTLADVQTLGPDLLAVVHTLCPADTMFGNSIRMAALQALTKYHFKEGIAAAVHFARTQGGHGSQSRTGEIMKLLVSYGSAARTVVPELKELIVFFNEQCRRGEFPAGKLNDQRIAAVEDAIKAIESATTQPELRTFTTTSTQSVKVFILAGQSNMEGQAVADLDGKNYNDGKGTLKALLRDPAKAGMFKHLIDAGRWADSAGRCAGAL